jgi:hypothetical protein
MSKIDSMNDSLVSHILYRVPKKNHDAMLQLCKEAYNMLAYERSDVKDGKRWKNGWIHETIHGSNTSWD